MILCHSIRRAYSYSHGCPPNADNIACIVESIVVDITDTEIYIQGCFVCRLDLSSLDTTAVSSFMCLFGPLFSSDLQGSAVDFKCSQIF